MAMRKSDLYRSIWESCDELRGGMDASQYKDYVLVLLFVKYVSDRYGSDPYAVIDIPKGGSFADMVGAKGKKDIGERFNKVLSTLAEANGLEGVIDVADFNDPDKLGSGREMVDRLTNLVSIFENPALNFSGNRADGDDLLGDAYEYLMRHFATESGKAKGQFYTPAEVSRVLAAVVGVELATDQKQSIYDPTCGSGSLLLKAHDAARRATGLDLAIYGQEKDNATSALARMNMFLHDAPTAEIEKGNTLSDPKWTTDSGGLKTFDYVVANPPFSTKSWKSGLNPEADQYGRFEFGIPPNKNGDYAFLLHILASLKSTGTGAVVLPHGVLFRGNAEARIRRNLVTRGYIKAIVGLPPNLFYGTSISACIMVIDKKHAKDRTGIFMIDASTGFAKDGAKNRLRERDIHRIVDVFRAQSDVPGYARMVPINEIASEANDYNLNLARYIDTSELEDIQYIEAHLRGGIPIRDVDLLKEYWEVMPTLRDELFAPNERDGYVDLKVEVDVVAGHVHSHPEFREFQAQVEEVFEGWQDHAKTVLSNINGETRPSELVADLSERLLAAFRPLPLIDEYAVYQRLMEYWESTLKDDVYLVAELGWTRAARPVRMPKKAGEKNRAAPDYVLGTGRDKAEYRSELIGAEHVIARYLTEENEAVETATAEKETAKARLSELEEEHATADGLLSEVINAKGNITKGAVSARIGELEEGDEERALLEVYRTVATDKIEADRQLAAATKSLAEDLDRVYHNLDTEEIVSVVVSDKWVASIHDGVRLELLAVTRSLAGRLEVLGTRYRDPLPNLVTATDQLRSTFERHLKAMGYWS